MAIIAMATCGGNRKRLSLTFNASRAPAAPLFQNRPCVASVTDKVRDRQGSRRTSFLQTMSTTSNRPQPSASPGSACDRSAIPAAVATAEQQSAFAPSQGQDLPGGAAAKHIGAAAAASAARQAPTRWAWNVPLLLITLAVIGVGAPLLAGLYYWQSSRIGSQLLHLADRAATDGKPQEEVQWLRRYLALQPDDVETQVRMALTFDENVQHWPQVDQSRRHLARALAVVEERDNALETDLRRRLTDRMLQLGGGWLIEAERQILRRHPAPEDPEALAQLAKSLLGQLNNEVSRPHAVAVPKREEDYWRWLVAQPVGDVLRLAMMANPESVELADAFIATALNKPELFTADSEGSPTVREQVGGVIEQLSQRSDDGRAQWTAYFYASRADVSVQPQPLAVAAAAALQRLEEHAVKFRPVEEGKASLQIEQPGEYTPLWDAQLVLAHAANLAGGQALDAAKDYYQSLASLPKDMLPHSLAEQSFLGLGRLHWQSGNRDAARQVWSQGNTQLGGANLVLLESLATSSIQFEAVEHARQDLERFADAIEAASLRLASEQRMMSPGQRDERQTRLNTATWRIDVFRAHLDMRDQDYLGAARRLERSVASQLTLDNKMRVDASELLAAAYGEQGLWDLAGRVLDAAAVIDPTNRSLKQRAAAAWHAASASTRAVEQWQRADDGSFESALAYAESIAASNSAKAPAQRDPRPLVVAIDAAQQRLEGMLAAGEEAPADAWRLSVMRLSLPAELRGAAAEPTEAGSASSADAGDRSPELQELVDLSLQYPQAVQLQALAALALQRAGQPAAAEEAMQRMLSIPAADPVFIAEARARMAAEQEKVDEAIKLLHEAFDAHPDNRLRMAKFAAGFLRSISRPTAAVQMLRKLDADEHDPQSLLQLGELLLASRQNSDSGGSGPAKSLPADIDVEGELQKVEHALRKLEGDEGTHWRLLAAQRLLQANDGDAAQRRLLLTQAAVLQSDILSRRPRWSRALALGGRIAAEQGDARKAVESLRRAITEGDKEAATVLLLVRQLNRLGEVAAAEQELERLENWTDSVGQISAMSVDLALAQGKHQNALERARAGVAARPGDAAAQVILAQAAAAIARSDAEQAEERHAEANQALQEAMKLTGGRDLSVWQAQFRLQADIGGRPAGRKVLEAMQQSALPANTRLLAVASGYLSIGDLNEARAWLDKAKQANPSDANVAMAQVALFRTTKDDEALLEALEQAHRLAPNHRDIRRQLAVALASQASDDSHWRRISELIGPERPGAAEDQLYHALLLITRGDEQRLDQARLLLDEMMRSADPVVADDATRLLLRIERRRWDQATAAGRADEATAALEACRKLYQPLVSRSQPNPIDLYGLGSLLLDAGEVSEAQSMASRLASVAPAARATLDLHLQVAKQSAEEGSFLQIVESWLKHHDDAHALETYSTAGQVMANLGLLSQAAELLRAAYQKNPAQLRNYVDVLVAADKAELAVSVCLKHYEQDRSPAPVRLLADVVVQTMATSLVSDTVDRLLDNAIEEFPTSAEMLESIGTLRLSQHRYEDAVLIYKKSEALNPASVLTLNNMAIAMAEIQGREIEALRQIERAIEIYGRNPELLDSLGIVQLRANLLKEAESTLREAYSRSGTAHHLLHLLFALDAQNKSAEVEQLWEKLDHSQLKPNALTTTDRAHLERLRNRFGMSKST